jgi:NAD dependent epimerase/dehydratase family enzyme
MGEVADAILEGDADLRPAKLAATGFQFLYPDLTSALRHGLSL